MTDHKPPINEISGETFPALRAFLHGYFHEDMAEEYDSPEEAVRQFCEDADSSELKAVAMEWSRFADRTRGRSLTEINRLLTTKLGSAHALPNPDCVEKISEVFGSFSSRRHRA